MVVHIQNSKNVGIDLWILVYLASFYEEDLGNILTSISFLVEDKVWDYKNYPSFEEELDDESETPVWLITMGGKQNLELRKFLSSKRLSM